MNSYNYSIKKQKHETERLVEENHMIERERKLADMKESLDIAKEDFNKEISMKQESLMNRKQKLRTLRINVKEKERDFMQDVEHMQRTELEFDDNFKTS